MSGHGFHVHRPHDHEVEHALQHNAKRGHTGLIAVITAILATVGALFSYMGGATQAKSGKQNLAELAIVLAPEDKRAGYKDEVARYKRYKKERAEIKVGADKLEAEAKDWDQQSDAQMHLHHPWA